MSQVTKPIKSVDPVRLMNSLEHVGTKYIEDAPPQTYPAHLLMTDEQFTLLNEAIDLLKKASKGYIKRAEQNPSETIKSTQTIERHKNRLRQLNDIIDQLKDNAY